MLTGAEGPGNFTLCTISTVFFYFRIYYPVTLTLRFFDMASVIQIGDAIKFAEIAWKLYDFGWASENNAGRL